MRKYKNPVSYTDNSKHTNPDPFILRWCGNYYCYSTDEFGVNISISEDLTHWEYKGYAIKEDAYHFYWAPSVIYWNGKFYMYYSNVPKEEKDCHYEWLKVAVSEKPEGPFIYEKTFFDEFSIDSHPYIRNGQLYLFYSVNNWYGTADKVSGTCILMDRMITPLEFEGKPRLVVEPTLKQEIYAANRFDDGRDWYTIEGACTVEHNEKCYLLYSANAYENVDYFVGTTIAQIKENAMEMEWKKYPNDYTWNPLIKKNDFVEGTGHNTVTKAPNMVDDWIVYHARNAEDELLYGVEQRTMRIDPLYYNGDEMYCFGPSYSEETAPAKPECSVKNIDISSREIFLDAPESYLAEYWIRGEKYHTGIRYGVLLAYEDEDNYLEVMLNSGKKEFEVILHQEKIVSSLGKLELPKEFDYTKPHKIQIEKRYKSYRIEVEERLNLQIDCDKEFKNGKIGLIPYFSKLHLCSMVVTKTINMYGMSLKDMHHMFHFSKNVLLNDGLHMGTEEVTLTQKGEDKYYTEEFALEVEQIENAFCYIRTDANLIQKINAQANYHVTHIVAPDEEVFLVDGEKIKVEIKEAGANIMEKMENQIVLKGLKISSYRYTKN